MNQAYLKTLFPAFGEIQDSEIRQQSLQAMLDAIHQGGWTEETLPRCPVTIHWKNCDVSWLEHVADVTDLCLRDYDRLFKYHKRHNASFDRDTVIAGALLHDIGKLLEFELHSDCVRNRPGAELLRHPLSGALIAAKAGLPDAILHVIATHSFEGEKSYRTTEADFVRSIDILVFNNSVAGLERAT